MLIEMMMAMGASATATAQPAAKAFVLDGEQIVYSETIDAKGTRHFRGRRAGGQPFAFRLFRDGRARGNVGSEPVRFRVGEAR